MISTRKPSTSFWTDSLPIDWDELSLRYLASIRNGSDYKEFEIEHGGYPVIGSGGEFARSSKYVHDGESVLLGRKGTIDKPLYINGRFWTVDTMFYTNVGQRIHAKFLHYFTTTIPFGYFQTNTAVPSMTQGDLGSIKIPLPGMETQQAVVSYLDRETAQIDNLIGKQEHLIELLAEKRRAVITQAVTKGLAPSAPSQLSGIPWLGEVNAEWPIRPLKAVGEINLGKMIQPIPKASGDFQAPYLRAANVQPDGVLIIDDVKEMWFNERELSSLDVLAGDVVVVEGGIGGFGRAAFVDKDLDGFGYQNSINRIRPNHDVDGRFLTYLLLTARQSGFIHAYCTGVSMPHLTAEKLAAIQVPLPDLATQTAIGDFLDRRLKSFSQLSSKASNVISMLQERRSALISAAVTGKINVLSKEL